MILKFQYFVAKRSEKAIACSTSAYCQARKNLQSWRNEYFKWVCGYANAQGGKLFIDVDDDGIVLGINNAKDFLENIPNQVRQFLGTLVGVTSLRKTTRVCLHSNLNEG